MAEDKNHHSHVSRLEQRFLWSLILNGGLAIGEIAMSIFAGSTALLADGLNNIDDVFALILSIYSERIAKKPPDECHTFGHGRVDVLAGFAKGCFLLISAFLVLFQVIHFLLEPGIIAGKTVLIVGGVAFIVNLLSALWLKGDARHSLNAKGTYFCMIYDAFGSLAVMISGLLSMLYGFVYFDIAASLFIVAFMVYSGWKVLGEGIRIFLQTVPEGFDYDAFERAVCTIDRVSSVGDIHVWSLTLQEHHLSCKITIEDGDICECDRIIREVEQIASRSGIQHTTVQPVYSMENIERFCGRY